MAGQRSDVWFRLTDLEVVSGSGAIVTTRDGTEYLDFTSGIRVANTGHGHPRVVAAIQRQAERFLHAQVNCFPISALGARAELMARWPSGPPSTRPPSDAE